MVPASILRLADRDFSCCDADVCFVFEDARIDYRVRNRLISDARGCLHRIFKRSIVWSRRASFLEKMSLSAALIDAAPDVKPRQRGEILGTTVDGRIAPWNFIREGLLTLANRAICSLLLKKCGAISACNGPSPRRREWNQFRCRGDD